MSPNCFTLHQKKPGAAYQACFCHLGEVKWWGTGSADEREATRNAKEVQPEILKELTLKAALKGKSNTEADAVVRKVSSGGVTSAPPPELDLTKPAPKGSLREDVEAEVALILKTKKSESRRREATESQKHLYQVYGAWVDLPKKSMDGVMAELLVTFYNDPVRFRLVGKTYAGHMKRFLKPMLNRGLPAAFIDALGNVNKQCDDDDASDPFRSHHYQKLHLRLETQLEADYLTGLHLFGCCAAPQLIDVVLGLWEGVDFGGDGWIKLYREKTNVIAEFRMSKPLRAWLWRRRQEAPPGARYIFGELVSSDEPGSPGFNQSLVPQDCEGAISSKVGTLWRAFMHRAGVPVGLMTFCQGDITDLKGFVEKLRSKATPTYAWFLGQCRSNCQKALLQSPLTEQEFVRIEELLVRNLNYVIQGEYCYDEKLFKEITLGGRTREWMNPGYKGVRLYTFHRLFLEDLFPELRRVEFSNWNYSYSSFRKGAVTFLRGINFRDTAIARILGQDSLKSQNIYDRVAEHEIQRGSELMERRVQAAIDGKTEFYPSTPFDFYEKMMEQFGFQGEILRQLKEELLRIKAEEQESATRRHIELVQAFQQGERQTQDLMTLKFETLENRMLNRLAAIEARPITIDEIGTQIIRGIPRDLPVPTKALLITCLRLALFFMFLILNSSRSASRRIAFATPVLQLGPPCEQKEGRGNPI